MKQVIVMRNETFVRCAHCGSLNRFSLKDLMIDMGTNANEDKLEGSVSVKCSNKECEKDFKVKVHSINVEAEKL